MGRLSSTPSRSRAHIQEVAETTGKWKVIRKTECRRDYTNEAWSFFYGDGQKVLSAAADSNPYGYLGKAIYRHLLKYANQTFRIGRKYKKRKKVVLLSLDRLDELLYPTAIERQMEQERNADFTLLLEEARGDVRLYLEAKALPSPLTADQIQVKYEWTRTRFEEIRRQVREWLGRQYPDEVGTISNPVLPPEFLAEITDLYRYNAAKDKLCSILFAPDEGDWVLMGPKSEVIAQRFGVPHEKWTAFSTTPLEVATA